MLVKSMPPISRPSSGLKMSFTRLLTTPVKAAPMMTPTARSTTLPRMMKSRNSPSQEGAFGRGSVDDMGLSVWFMTGFKAAAGSARQRDRAGLRTGAWVDHHDPVGAGAALQQHGQPVRQGGNAADPRSRRFVEHHGDAC